MDNKRRSSKSVIALAKLSTSELRGRQSVRATFKLSKGTVNAVSIVAAHLGIKQKSLFDYLVEDLQDVKDVSYIQNEGSEPKRVQKTYVLSRRSLDSLEQAAHLYAASRDSLVEQLVEKLKPIVERERSQHLKRKETLLDLQKCMQDTQKMLQKTRQMLGDDDLVTEKICAAVAALENTHKQVLQYVERGENIDDLNI